MSDIDVISGTPFSALVEPKRPIKIEKTEEEKKERKK